MKYIEQKANKHKYVPIQCMHLCMQFNLCLAVFLFILMYCTLRPSRPSNPSFPPISKHTFIHPRIRPRSHPYKCISIHLSIHTYTHILISINASTCIHNPPSLPFFLTLSRYCNYWYNMLWKNDLITIIT